MASHDASKVKKRRKWRLIKKGVTCLATRKRNRNIQLSLLADFLANHISAAGFSHVVKSPSPLRRKLWTVVIVITAISMIVMTYRVLQEYLEYSTIIRSKHKVPSELEFPAVTICSMSSIAKIFAKEANEDILMTITDYLNDLPKYNISEEDRTRCLKDPLCHWIWSLNVCKCYENPCQTSYCYKNISEDKCQCSEDMCEWKGSADACYLATDNNSMSKCTCSTNFTYPLAKLDQEFGDSNDDDDLYYMNKTLEFNVVSELSRRFRNQRDFHDANSMPWNIVTKNKYGLPIDSIILGCSFAGSSCSSSLLGVQIFYSSMIITHLNETPIYSWESLVSNIGGNMGLFLGISLVTLLEVFEFLVDTIRNAFAKREKLPSRITPVIIS